LTYRDFRVHANFPNLSAACRNAQIGVAVLSSPKNNMRPEVVML